MLQGEAKGKANGLARRLIGPIGALLLLCVVAVGFPASASAASYSLRVSGSPDRSLSLPLDGSTLLDKTYGQGAYVFMSSDAPGIWRVRFYLDEALVKTEYYPPFDFAGTNEDDTAIPFDITGLANGEHTLEAVIDSDSGEGSVIADFTVVKDSPPPPPPPDCERRPFHSPDDLPPACWRPFAPSSPFNQMIPADAKVASRSDEMVSRLLAAGSPNDGRAGIADTSSDYYKTIYFGRYFDPQFTIRGGSTADPYDVDGLTLRMPIQASPAGGSDHHLTVVYNGYEWGFWDARVDRASRTITVGAGRKVPIYGDGLSAAGTSARFANMAGRIRIQELRAGEINHALFMSSNSIASSYVYPAQKSDGGRDASAGYPPMGTRFQLAMTEGQIDALDVPFWKKTVLRALKNYGGYLGDSTSSPWSALSFESGSDYTSFGLPDPFVTFAVTRDLPSYFDFSIGRRVYTFDLGSGVDWARYLRVIDPCVAERTC
jgi:hypothetical protein